MSLLPQAENFLEKVLDKMQDLCYNNYRKRGKAYDRIY